MSTVVDSIRTRAFEVYERALGPAAKVSGGESWWPVPWREDSKASLRVNERGQWYDDPAGQGGDVITFWAKKTGRDTKTDFKLIVGELAKVLGIDASQPSTAPDGRLLPQAAGGPLDIIAPFYGLSGDDFRRAGCSVDKGVYFGAISAKHAAVIYPLAGPDGQTKRKAKSLNRFGVGNQATRWPEGKRASTHPGGGWGFFPATVADNRPADGSPRPELVVVAGEEKCLALIKAGLHAASYSCGEGSLKAKAAELLTSGMGYDRFVVILDAGRECIEGAPKWAEALTKAGAKSVRIAMWPDGTPDKYDLNDLIKDKGAAAVKELVSDAVMWRDPGRGPVIEWESDTVADLLSMPFDPIEWALPGVLPCGNLMILSAPEKSGKTFWALQAALAVAYGGEFLGRRCQQGRAVMHDYDGMGRRLYNQRLVSLKSSPTKNCRIIWPNGKRLTEEALESLRPILTGVRLWIIDNLTNALPATMNNRGNAQETDSGRISPLHNFCKTLPDTAVVLLHHTNRQTGRATFDNYAGSRGLGANCDGQIEIKLAGTGASAELAVRTRLAEPFVETMRRIHGGGWRTLNTDEAIGESRARVMEVLNDEPATAKEVAALVGVTEQGARQLLKRMATDGMVQRRGKQWFPLCCVSNVSLSEEKKETKETYETCSTFARARTRGAETDDTEDDGLNGFLDGFDR